MHGGNHRGIDIPFTLIGGGGGVLKKNFFANPPGDGYFVGDIHLTIMQKVFGMNITSFGPPTTQILPDILASAQQRTPRCKRSIDDTSLLTSRARRPRYFIGGLSCGQGGGGLRG